MHSDDLLKIEGQVREMLDTSSGVGYILERVQTEMHHANSEAADKLARARDGVQSGLRSASELAAALREMQSESGECAEEAGRAR